MSGAAQAASALAANHLKAVALVAADSIACWLWDSDAPSAGSRRRMLAALIASLGLHLGLIWGTPVSCPECSLGLLPGKRMIAARLVRQPGTLIATANVSLGEAAETSPAVPVGEHTPSPAEFSLGESPSAQAAAPTIEPEAFERVAPASPAKLFEPREYFASKDLDIRPHPINPIEPAIPENAGPQELTVILRLWISAEGMVDRVVTVSGPADERFSRSAATAFAMSRFSPGIKAGVPVGAEMLVEVSFDRETTAESKSSRQH